jgi:hypothetical protein
VGDGGESTRFCYKLGNFWLLYLLNFKNCKHDINCNTTFFATDLFTSGSNTGSTRDDPYWTSRKNSLELIELSSINKVSSV